MKSTYFITGTDTDVGKTLVTAALLHSAAQQGKRVFGLKPIAAGCFRDDTGALRNADALAIMAHSNVSLPYAQVNPCALQQPTAPHIAATHDGKRINLQHIEGVVRGALMKPADLRLIEGAGGWRIPLTARAQLADLPKRLQLPVILVVGMRLGCLNHALLTAQAIRADGLPLAGWVANCTDPQMQSVDENIQTLHSVLAAPCLGAVPYLSDADPAQAACHLTPSALL